MPFRLVSESHPCDDFSAYEKLKKEYDALALKYENSFEVLLKKAQSSVVREECSSGGETLHRGFYHPGSMDLVTGGLSRGRLLKRKSKSPSYRYYFDDRDRPVLVRKYDCGHLSNTEVILYLENKSIGFDFADLGEHAPSVLSFICSCHYENGRLAQCEQVLLHVVEKAVGEIQVERYCYDEENALKGWIWERYAPSIPLLTQERYAFQPD